MQLIAAFRYSCLILFFFLLSPLYSQAVDSKNTNSVTYKDVQSKARDHFMVQFGYLNWNKKPDSIYIAGFNRQVKFYGMYDLLIKGFPYMSVGIGAGFAWDNVYFNDTKLNITQNDYNTAQLVNHNDRERFEKSKLTTWYFEVPAELRFTTNIRNYNKGFKMAVGLSYGFLLQAHTKGVNLLNATGTSINNSKQIAIDSRYFNTSRLLAHARIGWGFIHLYGTYQLDALFTNTGGPNVSPYSFGIGLTGL